MEVAAKDRVGWKRVAYAPLGPTCKQIQPCELKKTGVCTAHNMTKQSATNTKIVQQNLKSLSE